MLIYFIAIFSSGGDYSFNYFYHLANNCPPYSHSEQLPTPPSISMVLQRFFSMILQRVFCICIFVVFFVQAGGGGTEGFKRERGLTRFQKGGLFPSFQTWVLFVSNGGQ